MITITALHQQHLEIPKWHVERGESWCVFGQTGSGQRALEQLLLGELTDTGANRDGHILPKPHTVQLISFEAQQKIFDREMQLAANDLLVEGEPGTPARAFLPTEQLDNELIDRLELRHRIDACYTQLSTGESRKLLLLKAMLEGAEVILLDNPFDSLDSRSITTLSNTLAALSREQNITLIFLLGNQQDIPDWVDQLATLEQGKLHVRGSWQTQEVREQFATARAATPTTQPDWPEDAVSLHDFPHDTLVNLVDCTVTYGGVAVLSHINLCIAPLQHTLITGENGSGKSTLLGLITGDCPQCYSNDVTVLGMRRGSGESVWDIKRELGIVGNDLHRSYRVHCDTLSVVVSGFFDSIGLYEQPSDWQISIAQQWLAAAGCAHLAKTPFQSLSFGEQRLVLIARALVKSPLLLVLDEPTQGLDELNRARFLNLLETLNARCHSTVVFVSHRMDEQLSIFKQHVTLTRNQDSP